MHNQREPEGAQDKLFTIVSSPIFQLGLSAFVIYQLIERNIFNTDAIAAAIVSLLLLAVAGFNQITASKMRYSSERFVAALIASWVILLVSVFPLAINQLAVSVALIGFSALVFNAKRVAISGLSLALAIEIQWLASADPIFVSELVSPLADIIIILFATLALYKITAHLNVEDMQKSTNKDSTDERKKLSALVNSMADGVIATDKDQKVTIYNGAALDILNVNVSLEGQIISDFFNLIDKKGKPVDVFTLAHKSRTNYVSRDFRLNIGENELINIYLSVAPVRVGYGEASTMGYIILIRDITKEKSLEEERDEFISVVSHELRTPITVAEGSISNAQLLLSKQADDKALSASLQEAHKNAVFLADMINDLATLSRAERGKLQVDPESVDFVELINNLADEYKIQAKQKGLKIKVPKHPKIKPVNTSPLYAKEILQNFVTNSIKYTEKGSITLSAKHKSNGVEVSVKDTGIGISKSDQNKLFEKFFRSEDYRTRKNNGTGLGLYVTLKLAKLIGAKITVESKLNKGSVFKVYFPNLEAHHHNKH